DLGQHGDCVDLLHGQHGEGGVVVQPAVKAVVAQGERRYRDAIVKSLVGVTDGARLDEFQVRAAEHLRVDAQILAAGQQLADAHRDAADAELDGRPVLDEGGDVGGDGAVRRG